MTAVQWFFVGFGGVLILVGLTYTGAYWSRHTRMRASTWGGPPDAPATLGGRVALVALGVLLACAGLLRWVA